MLDTSHIHLDAVGGLAGDMFVAGLLDALPELSPRVFADLAAAMPAHCGTPTLSDGLSSGIAVRRFALVSGETAKPAADHGHEHEEHEHHDHDHHHDHQHHDHQHHHAHEPGEAAHAHPVRFPEIAALISAAALHPGTAEQAIAILRRLAEAESRMHRVPLDEVHFHEIADWDSLMDIVAAGSIAAALAPCTWSVSPLPRGNGLVRTQHGLLPVPAPATTEILRGFRWRDDGVGGERVTPTGAAIVAHLVRDPLASPPAGVLAGAGTGAGTRELAGMPNVLRALIFSPEPTAASATKDEVIVVSFDIDDMSGEELAIAADRLRAEDGVIDVTVGSRQGKKGRTISAFRLLLRPAAFDAVCRACFLETTTIGLRWRCEQRVCLARGQECIDVGGHTLTRKRTQRPDGASSLKVESDEIAGLEGLAARRRVKQLAETERAKEQP